MNQDRDRRDRKDRKGQERTCRKLAWTKTGEGELYRVLLLLLIIQPLFRSALGLKPVDLWFLSFLSLFLSLSLSWWID